MKIDPLRTLISDWSHQVAHAASDGEPDELLEALTAAGYAVVPADTIARLEADAAEQMTKVGKIIDDAWLRKQKIYPRDFFDDIPGILTAAGYAVVPADTIARLEAEAAVLREALGAMVEQGIKDELDTAEDWDQLMSVARAALATDAGAAAAKVLEAAIKARDIQGDYDGFDGDRRGIHAALMDAWRDLYTKVDTLTGGGTDG